MSVRVQFVLNEDEYKKLKEAANKENVSISKYVKDCVFKASSEGGEGESFTDIWKEFCGKLVSFPTDTEFTIATVMTQGRWGTLNRSDKLSIARLFNKKVKSQADGFQNVRIVGRSPSNVTIYQKD